jgi:hypothetical protein
MSAIRYVQGTGWVCTNNSYKGNEPINYEPVQGSGRCVAAGLPRPPLQLFQCIPFPNFQFAIVYFVIGFPMLVLLMFLIHHFHKTALHYKSKENCVWPGHPLYKQWPYLFSEAERKSKYYTNSRQLVLLRYQELEHSFISFFFISRSDKFSWRQRLLCLALEQIINFFVQTFWTVFLYTGTFKQGSDPATILGTVQVIAVTVITSVFLSLAFPIRRLWGYTSRRKQSRIIQANQLLLRVAHIWLTFSVLIMLSLGFFSLIYTLQGGSLNGGQAPSQGDDLLYYSLAAYWAAVPYHLLSELVTGWFLINCCLPFRWFFIQRCDEYTKFFCLDDNGEVIIHDKSERRGLTIGVREAAAMLCAHFCFA